MKKRYVIAEIIIWAVILAVVFTVAIFTYSKIFVEPNVYTIQFKDIDGITKGSPVRFMGINVGYVRNLKSANKHINVQIIITKKDMKIPNGTIARVEFYGLGGSKSIELMPPDGSCDVGILTGDTIRINDIAQQAMGFVEILEEIEKYIKGLNGARMERFLEGVIEMKNSKIDNLGNEMTEINKNLNQKIENIKEKQNDVNQTIQTVNENVEKLNKFIKK